MNLKMYALSAAGVSLLAIGYAANSLLGQDSPAPELWYLHHSNVTSDEAVKKSKELIDQAAAAGYTGVVFWDSGFNKMSNEDWADNEDRMKEVMKYARKRKLKPVAQAVPFGWSNEVLAFNHNWAEAQRVLGSQFEVAADGKTLKPKDSFAGLANSNFEAGETGWFEMGDKGVGISTDAHWGKVAGKISDPPANGRLRQKIILKPWRQYYLSFFFKASGYQGDRPMVSVNDAADPTKNLFLVNVPVTETWGGYYYMFNSRDTTEAYLYLGVWGGAKGVALFDDVELQESSLVYVAHREGTPFKLYDPANPSTVYAEGTDYNQVLDPDMEAGPPAFHNVYHLPPAFTLPKQTRLKPGQIVAADYYAAFPLPYENQMGMCLSEPAIYKWLAGNAHAIKKVLPSDADVLLGYDEIRQANSCLACRSKKMTPGELLAWSVGKTLDIYHAAAPNTGIWVWSDMFDPHHNAKDNFYYAEGSFAGSWKALTPQVSVMNWSLDTRKDSLAWFAGLDPQQPVAHRQMIAGFYDKKDAAAEARQEVKDAAGVPGVTGVMYTTWVDDYSKMQIFANEVKAAWPAYLASLPKK